jgi:hypothetical protein
VKIKHKRTCNLVQQVGSGCSCGAEEADLVFRLRKRAEIRRGIPTRKSVQAGEKDRLAALLDEAAAEIERLRTHEFEPEEKALALDALAEAGHTCDRAVGGESKSGAAFRAVSAKVRAAL